MAETLLSPGILSRENDISQIQESLPGKATAIIGPTVKGKVDVPRYVTSYSEFKTYFGSVLTSGSDSYTYFTSITAYNYFQNGGTNLLVTRVASGSYTPATSSFISASSWAGPITGSSVFVLETLSEGIIMNNDHTEGTNNTLPSGTVDNVRWEIVSPDTQSGNFSLLVRRGDDSENQKSVLEQFLNVSLDPNAPNYISKMIGDQTETVRTDANGHFYLEVTGSYANKSKYVRVKAVNAKTVNYLDNNGIAKASLTGSIPIACSGTFGSATGDVKGGANFYENINSSNTQGLVAANYTRSLDLLSNNESFRYNTIVTPGLYDVDYSTTINTLITNTQNRGDAIAIIDMVKFGQTIISTVTQANGKNSSYAATYWPWLQTTDPDTGMIVWVPASTMIPGVYAYTDTRGEVWFAPAGLNRGSLRTVIRPERKLSKADRDQLYANKVNAIGPFPGAGVVVYGQKNLQTKASALDRVGVRRLLIELKDFISSIAGTLLFEQNTLATRNSFLNQVNPYLESVQQRQGLYAFKVVMDETNNNADVIDRNELVGQIYIQPTKTGEFVLLDFNILPTGAVFPS